MKRAPTKLWGGRFAGKQHPEFERFNRSVFDDHRLLHADVRGSIAWANALRGAGVLSAAERRQLVKVLQRWVWGGPRASDQGAEDVHTYVEQQLGKRVGVLARKLHTGRSRNDQVATDLKMHLYCDGTPTVMAYLRSVMMALVDLAERHADLPIPGYTHLQRAQPITVGHHALAYVEMFDRDRARLLDAWRRMATCPLGSGALAGCAFPVDRRALARELWFAGRPTRNSLDAVSDRDHVLELVFCCSTIMLHLSRLAEDYIFFASREAGFLTFSDAVATGSSLMPQKKNPDAMELIRGKTGRVLGALQALMTTMKGLPLAYDKDMQEDKRPLWDATDTTVDCLRIATIVVKNVTFDEQRCRAAAAEGHMNATDLADLLVRKGVPFRDAHERTGKAVRRALELGVELQDLPEQEQRKLFPELDVDLKRELSVDKVLARRNVIGGTAPRRVRAEVRAWKKRLRERLKRLLP